jgi:hypothetical protein
MSQTTQQEQGAARPKPRKDWELFWRIIAGLMLLVIGWVVWVLYQITPRSVVTPLAYASQIKPIDTHPTAAALAPAGVAPSAPQPPPEPTAADRAMALAQEAARSGAHQPSADIQAAAMGNQAEAVKPEPAKGEGLRLATEIAVPPAGKPGIPIKQEGKPEGASAVPAASGAAGKSRP